MGLAYFASKTPLVPWLPPGSLRAFCVPPGTPGDLLATLQIYCNLQYFVHVTSLGAVCGPSGSEQGLPRSSWRPPGPSQSLPRSLQGLPGASRIFPESSETFPKTFMSFVEAFWAFLASPRGLLGPKRLCKPQEGFKHSSCPAVFQNG